MSSVNCFRQSAIDALASAYTVRKSSFDVLKDDSEDYPSLYFYWDFPRVQHTFLSSDLSNVYVQVPFSPPCNSLYAFSCSQDVCRLQLEDRLAEAASRVSIVRIAVTKYFGIVQKASALKY